MRYVTLAQALVIRDRILAQSGGLAGILSLGALESALAQLIAALWDSVDRKWPNKGGLL
jgi:hypothetical protein